MCSGKIVSMFAYIFHSENEKKCIRMSWGCWRCWNLWFLFFIIYIFHLISHWRFCLCFSISLCKLSNLNFKVFFSLSLSLFLSFRRFLCLLLHHFVKEERERETEGRENDGSNCINSDKYLRKRKGKKSKKPF